MVKHKLEEDKVYKHFIERTRLGDGQKIFLYSSTGLLWLSGLIWVLYHYFWLQSGEFGPVRSPMESFSIKVHGAVAMVFMIVLGSLIPAHLRRGWVLKRNRLSGVFLTGGCASLIVTGWALYYLATERGRAAIGLFHWGFGLLLPLIIYLHILAWRREQDQME